MQNVDLDNLDSEQLFKIKDKYQSPQFIRNEAAGVLFFNDKS